MTKRLILSLGMFLCLAPGVHAEDSVVDQTKDAAKTAADGVDKSAHSAKRTVKHHARKAKTTVQNSTDDSTVDKAGRRMKDTGNDALDKVDDTVHGH